MNFWVKKSVFEVFLNHFTTSYMKLTFFFFCSLKKEKKHLTEMIHFKNALIYAINELFQSDRILNWIKAIQTMSNDNVWFYPIKFFIKFFLFIVQSLLVHKAYTLSEIYTRCIFAFLKLRLMQGAIYPILAMMLLQSFDG